MSYSVQLISPQEKDQLYEAYEPRLLYTSKAEIYGCCIKILTNSEVIKEQMGRQLFQRKRKQSLTRTPCCVIRAKATF